MTSPARASKRHRTLKFYGTTQTDLDLPESITTSIDKAQDALKDVAVSLELARHKLDDEHGENASKQLDTLYSKLSQVNSAYQRTMQVALQQVLQRSSLGAVRSYAKEHSANEELLTGTLDTECDIEPLDAVFNKQYDLSLEQVLQQDPEPRYRTGNVDSQFLRFWNSIAKATNPSADLTRADLSQYYGDDLLLATTVQSTKCPLSKQTLEDPVVAKCGHHFSRTSIMEMLQQHEKIHCPVSACNKAITAAGLCSDPVMAERVARILKREGRQRAKETQSIVRV